MTLGLILFFILAAVAVLSALGMLFSRNAVYSALCLIINFGAVAIFYLSLDAPFIAISQVTVYAGAIMVLFLFVIMLLGAEQLRVVQTLAWQQPLAIFLSIILLAEAGYLLFTQRGALAAGGTSQAGAALAATFGSPTTIGSALFNEYLLPFEVTSILLLVAMVGAIVLTKGEKK